MEDIKHEVWFTDAATTFNTHDSATNMVRQDAIWSQQ
jgi:hypothetical protein